MASSARWRWIVSALVLLLLVVMLMVQCSVPAHGHPDFDQGCPCHNGGIGVYVNGTDWNGAEGFGLISFNMNAGSSVSLLVTTTNIGFTNVPAQAWLSNQTDNSKFIFSPQIVYDLDKTNHTVTALYNITAPTILHAGAYRITQTTQGNVGITIWVYVNGSAAIPEFDNATLILTLSAIVIVVAFAAMHARPNFYRFQRQR